MTVKLFLIGKKIIPKKIKHHFSKLYYLLNNYVKHGTTDFFRAVEIETLTKCNRKCFYCPNSKYDRGDQYMEESLYKKIIDELAELNYNGRVSPHFYGEPLGDKRLPDLLGYTRQKLPSAYIVVFTNGDFLTKEMFDLLLSKGVDAFLITRHVGPDSETLKKMLNSLSAAEKKKVTLRKFTPDTTLSNRGGLIDKIKTEYMNKCNFPATSLIIDFQGNVILCCNDFFSSVKFGNLTTEKINEVWKKPNFIKLRKELQDGKFKLDICKKCVNMQD
ncbi:SPASM domain-containing protein [Candidatus Woesearchaeota archaeon]|nr:SPASM domain-containing protein [Candidatus Woesearchaeota archaeon]